MAVEKGQEWGSSGRPPPAAEEIHTDAEAAQLVAGALRAGRDPPPVLLRGGDLFRTLGGHPDRESPGMCFRVDVGEVQHDDSTDYFVAHLIARGSWWRGRVVALMNAEFRGPWKVAPRAHPGDGLLDLIDADPTFRQRLLARRRLAHGDHLPHPDIATSRVRSAQLAFDSPRGLWLDGMRAAATARLAVDVLPDCLEVYV